MKSLSQTSETLSQKTSEVLIGTLGGVIGGLGGYAFDIALHLALPGIPITMGGALGLVGCMLLWRGPKRLLAERHRRADERELLHRVDYSNNLQAKLGANAPPQLIEAARNYPMTGVMSVPASVPYPPPPTSIIPDRTIDLGDDAAGELG